MEILIFQILQGNSINTTEHKQAILQTTYSIGLNLSLQKSLLFQPGKTKNHPSLMKLWQHTTRQKEKE
jgi:hypothetical protein